MIWKSEEMLDLNEESVQNLFSYCVVAQGDSSENTCCVSFISPACQLPFPPVYFYRHKLEEIKNTVAFLLGQLLVVHLRNDRFPIGYGFLKYDKTRWTENKFALFSLCYLAVGAGLLPPFEPAEKKENMLDCALSSQNVLRKTISPSDPAFQEFCEDLEYHEMLPRLIAEKKKYYASPEYKRRKEDALALAAIMQGKGFAATARSAQDRLEAFDTDEEMLQALSKKAAEKARATMKLYAICE